MRCLCIFIVIGVLAMLSLGGCAISETHGRPWQYEGHANQYRGDVDHDYGDRGGPFARPGARDAYED